MQPGQAPNAFSEASFQVDQSVDTPNPLTGALPKIDSPLTSGHVSRDQYQERPSPNLGLERNSTAVSPSVGTTKQWRTEARLGTLFRAKGKDIANQLVSFLARILLFFERLFRKLLGLATGRPSPVAPQKLATPVKKDPSMLELSEKQREKRLKAAAQEAQRIKRAGP
jgi:hypothetical protein